MKLWQRICLYSLLLFVPVLLCCGILMIEHNKKIAFEWKLKQAASEQTGISSGLMRYIMLERMREGMMVGARDKEYITDFLSSHMNTGGIYLAIRNQQDILYSNFEWDISKMIDNFTYYTTSEYKIYQQEDKTYLMLSCYIPLEFNELNSIYMIDISDIYREREQQYLFFGKLTAAAVLLLTVGMYLIAGYLTKPLRILTKAVQKVEGGNYTHRILIQSENEFGRLIESHNNMVNAIEEKVRELEDKNREQQRFVDNFTHELKTPLTAVVGYADLLRSVRCEEEEAQELGEHIFKQGKRIERLSELMMELTSLSKHSFTRRLCNMEEIILEAKESFEPLLLEKKIKFLCVLPNEPILFLGERELIIHLLGNLLDNAKKASNMGDCIWLRGSKEEEMAVLSVEDVGKGIPQEEKAKIFEPFYMVDKVRNGDNNGLGLGLSICADIAKINEAKIELTSEEGKGTKIKVIFPCYKPDTKTD